MPGATPPPSSGCRGLSYGDTKLSSEDLALLEPTRWLNDNLIAFWLEYLESEALPQLRSRGAVLLSPQVVQLIRSLEPSQIPLILESHSMATKKELWLLPINNCRVGMEPGGSHWSLLVFWRGFFHHLDSMGGINHRIATEVAALLSAAFSLPPRSAKVTESPCTPQDNAYDCGVHVVCNARAVCQLFLDSDATSLPSVSFLANRAVLDCCRQELRTLVSQLSQRQQDSS